MSNRVSFYLAVVLVGLGFVAFIIGFQVRTSCGATYDYRVLNLLGDYVGGVCGALWALAGVFLFYNSITIQRDELNLTRKEFAHQTFTITVQRFELTFFNLLEMLRLQASTTGNFYQIKRTLDNNASTLSRADLLERIIRGGGDYSSLIPFVSSLNVTLQYMEDDSSVLIASLDSNDETNLQEQLDTDKYYRILDSNISLDQKIVLYYIGALLKYENHILREQFSCLIKNLERFNPENVTDNLKLPNVEALLC
jgi:hypothetical protein